MKHLILLLILAGAAVAGELDAILARIDELDKTGVVFDDTDGGGSVPVKRGDGKYHMCCIDLLNVAYRNAGIHLPGAGRSVANLVSLIKRDKRFAYYPGPGVNPWLTGWKTRVPFRVGDMVFVHYDDNHDRHSGIVTGVDPETGMPSYITQVSFYSDNKGLHRTTYAGFFSLRCRQLTGWARPVAWNSQPVSETEKKLMVKAPVVPIKPFRAFDGDSAAQMVAALQKVRNARREAERKPVSVWVVPAGHHH